MMEFQKFFSNHTLTHHLPEPEVGDYARCLYRVAGENEGLLLREGPIVFVLPRRQVPTHDQLMKYWQPQTPHQERVHSRACPQHDRIVVNFGEKEYFVIPYTNLNPRYKLQLWKNTGDGLESIPPWWVGHS